MDLVNIPWTKKNHQPKTTMNDLALQLAVSSVLQSWDSENDVFLQNCKDCKLQMVLRFAVTIQTEIWVNTDSIFKDTRQVARSLAQNAAWNPVLPDMLTRRHRSCSLITWADATISTVAATIIPQRNVFRTTRLSKKCWLNKRRMATIYQQPSHQRQSRCLIPYQRLLIFPQIG